MRKNRINMKKFIHKSFAFIIIFVILIVALDLLSAQNDDFSAYFGKLTNSSDYSRYAGNTGTTEILPCIAKAQWNDGCKKLIIGDSVCYLLYNDLQNINKDYSIIGTNRAVTMTGQYILAKKFLELHPEATDIYLIVILDTFDSYFDLAFGYQYAVMPFVETDTFDLLDDNTIALAEDTYGKLFTTKRAVDLIDSSAMNRKLYMNLLQKYGKKPEKAGETISPQTYQYLEKMSELCEKNSVNLHILPGPLADTELRHEQEARQIEEFKEQGLYPLMEKYFNTISYYPEEQFRDGIHLGGEYANQQEYNIKIEELREKSAELEDLVLEVK